MSTDRVIEQVSARDLQAGDWIRTGADLSVVERVITGRKWTTLELAGALRPLRVLPDMMWTVSRKPTAEMAERHLRVKLDRLPDSDAVTVEKSHIRALLDEVGRLRAINASTPEVSGARDHAEAESLHRDDLARDAARLWTARRHLAEVHGLPPALVNALDRLAAAYGEKPDGKGD